MFKPCAIIPVYNHHQKITTVVAQLRELGLPCLLLDDGSDEPCRTVLSQVAESDDAVTLIRHELNRGKGAVVCDALQQAFALGFTHALQVDADGQHDLADVPAFLAQAQQTPAAVVSGARSYQQLPKSRRYGRRFTDWWVWIHTLSLTIKDSMCGYRLYPLAATTELLSRTMVGQRMDFDTDILVRLYWQGLAVEHIDTDIRYNDETVSHFKLWGDNLRITWMHTRLFFGMLLRIPCLIKRRYKKGAIADAKEGI